MKSILLLITLFFISIMTTCSYSQIVVAENTLKVAGLSEEIFYYGFSEGDQLVFNFEELKGKELKEIEIIELPNSSKFMDYKSVKIENKIIQVYKTGIYKFRFYNSNISGRICKVKIQRIPTSTASNTFDTNVYWRTLYDTLYVPTEEKFLISSDTLVTEVHSSLAQISSQNAMNGNSNKNTISFELPPQTFGWSFYIGAGKEGKAEYDVANSKFTQSVAGKVLTIPGYGPMAALAVLGVQYFSKVQGEDNVKYWFIPDHENVLLFHSNQIFKSYKNGDVVNEACQMKNPKQGKAYLILYNDNSVEAIQVTVKVVAVSVVEKWGIRIIQKMVINKRQEAYLKN